MLHQNGTTPAPRTTRGAFAAQRTEFLPDRPADSSRAVAYLLARRQLLGLPLQRWLYGVVAFLVLVWLLARFPAPGWAVAVGLWAILGMWLWARQGRTGHYVRFLPGDLPNAVTPVALDADAKLPLYVSGWLTVQNKAQQFAGVPAFYRTFPTREHALLCRVRARTAWGVVEWPPEEVGLWYAFFRPEQIIAVRPGTVQFDQEALPGVVVDYRPTDPALLKKRRQAQQTTVYLAFPDAMTRNDVLADLLVETIRETQAG
jgi:hypothetical protein